MLLMLTHEMWYYGQKSDDWMYWNVMMTASRCIGVMERDYCDGRVINQSELIHLIHFTPSTHPHQQHHSRSLGVNQSRVGYQYLYFKRIFKESE